MNSVLAKTIETILEERDLAWDASHDCVDELLEEYGEPGFAEAIFRDVPGTVPWEIVADIFNMALWSGSDNGAGISATTNRWLREGDDARKMLIALNLEFLPYGSKGEALEALKKVPDEMWIVRSHIQRAIAGWERPGGG